MKVLALAIAIGMLALLTASGSGSARSRSPRYQPALASFPTFGTVYGRYEGCRTSRPRFSLGIRLSADASSTSVRFRAGRFVRNRKLWNPPYPTSWFRYSSQRVQWLAAEATGEGGTDAAVVRVAFLAGEYGGWECAYHTPPRVTVQVYPRQPSQKFPHGGFGGMLRPPIK